MTSAASIDGAREKIRALDTGHIPSADDLPRNFLAYEDSIEFRSASRIDIHRAFRKSADREAIIAFTRTVDQRRMSDLQTLPEAELKGKYSAEQIDEGRRWVATLDRAFDVLPKHPMTVFRGHSNVAPAVLHGLLASDTFELPRHSSASRDPAVGARFAAKADNTPEQVHVVLVLHQRSAIAIEGVSGFKNEREMAIRGGTRFGIVRRAQISANTLLVEANELHSSL